MPFSNSVPLHFKSLSLPYFNEVAHMTDSIQYHPADALMSHLGEVVKACVAQGQLCFCCLRGVCRGRTSGVQLRVTAGGVSLLVARMPAMWVTPAVS